MTASRQRPILLLGAGRMGGAMLRRWLQGGLDPAGLFVHDPDPPKESAELIARARLPFNRPLADLPLPPAAVVLAVKPALVPQALRYAAPALAPDSVLLSIAAGVSLQTLCAGRSPPPPAVRVMPNIPAVLGKGVIAACAADGLTPDQKKLCSGLLAQLGDLHWFQDEAKIDAATALSGSGPAYVFALAEAMTQAGARLGLDSSTAAAMTRQTLIGAAALLDADPHSPAELRAQVTSPGGTTQAALEILLSGTANDLSALLARAMTRAHRRAKDLGR